MVSITQHQIAKAPPWRDIWLRSIGLWRFLVGDARHFQIAWHSSFVIYGATSLDFDITWTKAVAIHFTALLTQWAASRIVKCPFEPRGALISALGLCIILRGAHPGWLALAAFLAVASKFVVRIRGKHIFNPTNGAMVLMLVAGAPVWISPGQWGDMIVLAFLVGALGIVVVTRAKRADTAFIFLGVWAAMMFGRSLWLHEPMTIPLHRMHNGALLLFAFFMITDPMTSPNHRVGRVIYVLITTCFAYWWQFMLFRTDGLIYGLAVACCFVPLIDRLFKAPQPMWIAPPEKPAGVTP